MLLVATLVGSKQYKEQPPRSADSSSVCVRKVLRYAPKSVELVEKPCNLRRTTICRGHWHCFFSDTDSRASWEEPREAGCPAAPCGILGTGPAKFAGFAEDFSLDSLGNLGWPHALLVDANRDFSRICVLLRLGRHSRGVPSGLCSPQSCRSPLVDRGT